MALELFPYLTCLVVLKLGFSGCSGLVCGSDLIPELSQLQGKLIIAGLQAGHAVQPGLTLPGGDLPCLPALQRSLCLCLLCLSPAAHKQQRWQMRQSAAAPFS